MTAAVERRAGSRTGARTETAAVAIESASLRFRPMGVRRGVTGMRSTPEDAAPPARPGCPPTASRPTAANSELRESAAVVLLPGSRPATRAWRPARQGTSLRMKTVMNAPAQMPEATDKRTYSLSVRTAACVIEDKVASARERQSTRTCCIESAVDVGVVTRSDAGRSSCHRTATCSRTVLPHWVAQVARSLVFLFKFAPPSRLSNGRRPPDVHLSTTPVSR